MHEAAHSVLGRRGRRRDARDSLRRDARVAGRDIVLGSHLHDCDGLHCPCLQEERRHVRCHEGVTRMLGFVMLREKAVNKNQIFFYTLDHELSSLSFLKDVNVMPEPRGGCSYLKGRLVVVGGEGGVLGVHFSSDQPFIPGRRPGMNDRVSVMESPNN